MKVIDFIEKKKKAEKISIITCYDYTSSRILSNTSVDCLLVGDSVAMTMHGFQDTLSATLEMMCFHTAAVRRGAHDKLIVSDLPFLSYRKSTNKNISAIQSLIQAGANAVKLEAAAGNLALIKHLTESGVPVMGHLGLTPQFINAFGGYKIQGKTGETAEKLKQDALALEDAGCFSVVLECVPHSLAKEITCSLQIPTIGIGAGAFTDGQVLVFQDVLGLNTDFKPKFVKEFLDGNTYFKNAIEAFVHAVQTGAFPQHAHCY